jgi:rhodanese-related sulfurtransferase
MMPNKANTFIKILICCHLSVFLFSVGACQSSKARDKNNIEYDIVQKGEYSPVKDVEVNELRAAFEKKDADVVILDVRTKKEVDAGHVEGSMNLDFYQKDFQSEVKKLDKTKTYYVYCRSGKRSNNTRNLMLQNDFQKVYNVSGGFKAWEEAGYPVYKE